MARYMLYIELSVAILVYYVYSENFESELCLETALMLATNYKACDFASSDVNSLLSDGQVSCLYTCEARLDYIFGSRYKIKNIHLTFDWPWNSHTIKKDCDQYYYGTYINDLTLEVDCTALKYGRIGSLCFNDDNCQKSNTECHFPSVKLHEGVCVCESGIVTAGGQCVDADVPLGQPCVSSMQCTMNTFAGVCVNDACACHEGYINHTNTCYPDKVRVGGACATDEQCTGTDNSRVCNNSRCVCSQGYISIQGDCHRADVPLGQDCVFDMQCKRSPFLGACVNRTCACQEGYINHNNTCYPDNVLVGGACVTDEQCSGTEHSGVCEEQICTCKEGYLSIPGHCYRGNLSLNQSCELHEQCTATPHAVCQNKTCTCEDRYSVVNTTYCEHRELLPAKSFEQLQADGNGPVSIVGALIGGLVGGVLVTTLIACILYKRSNTNVKKREEPAAMFIVNDSYGSNSNIERGFNSGTKEDKPRKVVNVPPYARSADSPTYSNVREASEQPPNDDVYNHLHEEEKQDTDDDYDHTTGITDHVTADSDYSHLHSGGGNRRLNLSVDDEYANASAVSVDTSTDDYFTLEKQ